MSANNCTQFRPHQLRPDKCRNCFGDKSRHQQDAEAQQQQQQQATSEKKQSPNDNDTTNSDTKIDGSRSQDELLVDLRRCHEEREKLKESNEKNCCALTEKNKLIEGYKKEIEVLRSKLVATEKKSGSGETSNDVEQLKLELQAMRSRLEKSESQRDQAQDEVRALEREMEEMHDNFKEEESEQFEQLKQELDLATKNCKILQIRLGKAERQYGQLEQVKSMLEQQLDEWNTRQRAPPTLQEADQATNYSFGQVHQGEDYVKISNREYDQLLRDLNDTIEREKDLQEQIKYSQEEAQMKSDRLQAVEAENEVLLSKVNKLTLANSRLRSNPMRSIERNESSESPATAGGVAFNQAAAASSGSSGSDACDLIQQSEQMKLALDLAQSEVERLRHKCQESGAREQALKELASRNQQLEEELASLVDSGSGNNNNGPPGVSDNQQLQQQRSGELSLSKLELECRQLRTRLVHSERECKQLKAELGDRVGRTTGDGHPRLAALGHSLSMEGSGPSAEGAKLREIVRQLREECNSLKGQNRELELRLEQLNANQNLGGTKMESDLLDKLKSQLEASESELAKTKSRLVELDLEHGRLQRQHKRLIEESAVNNATTATGGTGQVRVERRVKLPAEQQRDSMGRQELRQCLKELEAEADDLAARLSSALTKAQASGGEPEAGEAEQVRSLRRLLDQERLLSNNLKLDVAELEKSRLELETMVSMLERERVVMEEELDKLRQLNSELDLNLEEAKRGQRQVSARLKDSQVTIAGLREEIQQLKGAAKVVKKTEQQLQQQQQQQEASGDQSGAVSGGKNSPSSERTDVLLLMRDLSELKVKNGFLMRQLEIAREDTARQLDDLRQAHELQQRRQVELAQLELKERHLMEGQQLRDELQEVKQRLVQSQRLVTRNEEETAGERDRLRSMERDWRRDKSQWQQRLEQLEAQLAIERRSNEYKSKEWESLMRDKERELISVQDKYVQLERDFKRLQNKYSLLEESGESKQKSLARDLECKKRELSDLMAINQKREDDYYDKCKRFNNERGTLMETLESLKRSYDEKLAELKSCRELLALRQEQSYKERQTAQTELEHLNGELTRMSEHESQAKLLRQQLQVQERHLEGLKRDQQQLKEERSRLKARCEELERRCHRYEKQELITKTSHISSSTAASSGPGGGSSGASFLLRNPFHSSGGGGNARPGAGRKSQDELQTGASAQAEEGKGGEHEFMVEKLTSKINDQRHLINLLKQQNEELQLEVKQLRLIQSSDKVRWQGRVAQLQSRLNACEEKLLFESSLLTRDTFETSRRKLEVHWAEERQSSLDTIQQLQAQNELLTRDLKKLGQAHELLRLQSKQLESHNNKLSRRLIEYQQQPMIVQSTPAPSQHKRELDTCQAHRDQLIRLNTKLVELMKAEAKPLVETVSKMVAALDVSSTEPARQPPEAGSSQSSAEPTQENPLLTKLPVESSARPISTYRPLMTSSASNPPDLQVKSTSTARKSTTTTAQERSTTPSRLARFLGSKPAKSSEAESEPTSAAGEPTKTSSSAKTTKTGVKRVRVKSSSLGITLAEKKQLKRHLEQLDSAIDGLAAELKLVASAAESSSASSVQPAAPQRAAFQQQQQLQLQRQVADRNQRAGSSPVDRAGPATTLAQHSFGHQQRDTDSTGSGTPSRVRWQLDTTGPAADSSDLDSNKSWSAGNKMPMAAAPVNQYRRFPQSSPGSYGASLTDYESESSLASFDDLSTATYNMGGGPVRSRFTSGAESDSCLGQQQQLGRPGTKLKPGGTKKRTLRTRLTSTLRNISRSITGLASDSETESLEGGGGGGSGGYRRAASESRSRPIRLDRRGQLEHDEGDNNSNDADHEGPMREIRV